MTASDDPIQIRLRGVAKAFGSRAVLRGVDLDIERGRVQAKLPAALPLPLRRVIALARALVPNPEILICDEPTTALEPASAQRVEQVLAAAASDRRATVLLATFDLPLAFRIGHRVSALAEGRIAASGTPRELLADPPPALRQLLQSCGSPLLAEGGAQED